MTKARHASIILHMLKIKEFCKIRGISLYRLAKEASINEDTLRKRAKLNWEAFHSGGTLTLKSPKGGVFTYEGVDI